MFCLTFGSDGAFTRADVLDMSVGERFGYIERLANARRREKDEIDRIRRESKLKRGGLLETRKSWAWLDPIESGG